MVTYVVDRTEWKSRLF